jgi:5'-3' exoribonuclease 2
VTNLPLSVYYERPASTHQHKSMLLRGVRLPTPALNDSDIEVLKGKASRSGRGYGGAPFNRSGYGDADRRVPINYGPGSYNQRNQYNHPPRGNFHSTPTNAGQWRQTTHPPRPGHPGFGIGIPPPPPPTLYSGSRASGRDAGDPRDSGSFRTRSGHWNGGGYQPRDYHQGRSHRNGH